MSQPASTSQDVRLPNESERDPRLEREGIEHWFALGQDDSAALCDPDAAAGFTSRRILAPTSTSARRSS
jgi:hypothetical protein